MAEITLRKMQYFDAIAEKDWLIFDWSNGNEGFETRMELDFDIHVNSHPKVNDYEKPLINSLIAKIKNSTKNLENTLKPLKSAICWFITVEV